MCCVSADIVPDTPHYTPVVLLRNVPDIQAVEPTA
jgi:hypothetical protein